MKQVSRKLCKGIEDSIDLSFMVPFDPHNHTWEMHNLIFGRVDLVRSAVYENKYNDNG
jgi:hypothetical protein